MQRNRISISSDRDVVVVLDESSGLKQVLLPADAQVLLDKLIEFHHQEGSTDVSLSEHRGLTVVGTLHDVRFSFFYRTQGPQTWITLNLQQVQAAINQLEALLSRPDVNE